MSCHYVLTASDGSTPRVGKKLFRLCVYLGTTWRQIDEARVFNSLTVTTLNNMQQNTCEAKLHIQTRLMMKVSHNHQHVIRHVSASYDVNSATDHYFHRLLIC